MHAYMRSFHKTFMHAYMRQYEVLLQDYHYSYATVNNTVNA